MNETPPPQQPSLVRRLRVAVVVLAALAIGLVAWAAIGGDGDEESDNGAAVEASAVSAAELGELAADAEGPVYWAGERPGAELEYDEAGERAFVRYLSGGAEAGDPRPVFLTIATYPLADPADALRANARRTNTRLQRAPGGALVWVNPDRPQSVYLAEPGSTHQVEVYDPQPRRALSVALSGEVVRIG